MASLTFLADLEVPEGHRLALTSGKLADYSSQPTGFADYSRGPAPGSTLTRLSWVEPVGPFPPLGTPGPVVPPADKKLRTLLKPSDRCLTASQVPGTTIIEIGSHGAQRIWTVAVPPQVQKKLTPKSVYPCVDKAREIKSRLDLVGTTEVMKNLELSSGLVDDEAMAP
jgi:hypothetical protein